MGFFIKTITDRNFFFQSEGVIKPVIVEGPTPIHVFATTGEQNPASLSPASPYNYGSNPNATGPGGETSPEFEGSPYGGASAPPASPYSYDANVSGLIFFKKSIHGQNIFVFLGYGSSGSGQAGVMNHTLDAIPTTNDADVGSSHV